MGPEGARQTAGDAAATSFHKPLYFHLRDAFRQLMLKEAGFIPETVDLGVMCHLDAFRAGKAQRVTTDFQTLTQRQPTSVQQWWCQHAAMFLSHPESQDQA